jgi:hypothetical protein
MLPVWIQAVIFLKQMCSISYDFSHMSHSNDYLTHPLHITPLRFSFNHKRVMLNASYFVCIDIKKVWINY